MCYRGQKKTRRSLRCNQFPGGFLNEILGRVSDYSGTIRNIFHHYSTGTDRNIIADDDTLADYGVGPDKCIATYFNITTKHCTGSDMGEITNDTLMIYTGRGISVC